MLYEKDSLRFLATGIGSVPFLDIEATCRQILSLFPEIPFWPQFVKRSHVEDMTFQFTEHLPLVKADPRARKLSISAQTDKERELVEFYEKFIAEDTDYFAVSERYAPGVYALLKALPSEPNSHCKFIKGQIVGPITFAASIMGPNGKAALYEAEILEALTNAISIKGLWQVKKLSESGRRPILFIDEPYLSGFGSAFSPISREKVIEVLGTTIEFLKQRANVLVGIHCCGNTDWAMLLEAAPDIINFDAYGYMDYFLLYRPAIKDFMERGGYLAWGIVPTSEFTGSETAQGLKARLEKGIERLVKSGMDKERIEDQSLLTPACGMGSMAPTDATQASKILSQLSRMLRTQT